MGDKIDFAPGFDDSLPINSDPNKIGKITEDGCCPCCLGPCYGGCEICDQPDEGGSTFDKEKNTPSCCTGRCCTCFPGSGPVIDVLSNGDPYNPTPTIDGGGYAWSKFPPFSKVELEASFFLADCKYDTDAAANVNSPCNGYLGSITLCGSDTVGPASGAGTGELYDKVPALCIRQTDGPPGSYDGAYGGQDCTKQICNQKTRNKFPPRDGLDIYEIWCGAGRICYEDQRPGTRNTGKDPTIPSWNRSDCIYPLDCTEDRPPRVATVDSPAVICGEGDDYIGGEPHPEVAVPVGQFVEMSVCCCKGNDSSTFVAGNPPDCYRGLAWRVPKGGEDNQEFNSSVADPEYYNCEQIKKDVADEKVHIDQVCSCACYTVDFKFHDVNHYPYISAYGTQPPPNDKCWIAATGDCTVSSFTPTLQPSAGCPTHSKCPMEITDCRCMDAEGERDSIVDPPAPKHADGWYICAEYTNTTPFVCSCCPGIPDAPMGYTPSIPRGGCKSPNKIRVFITVKESSKAKDNPRRDSTGATYCPSCPSD